MSDLDRQFWKPQDKDKPKYSNRIPAKKKLSKKDKLREKRNDRRRQRYQARKGLIKYFAIQKYATNMAICLCIHNECGIEMPSTEKAAIRMIMDFWKKVSGKKSHRKYNYMSSDEFYSSNKWREIRFIALQQSGGRCTLCGASASDGVQLHVDHILPRSKYPGNQFDLDNLQILCSDCNLGKSNYDETDFR